MTDVTDVTEKIIRVFADGVGEIRFDGVRAAASRLDPGYPGIRRIVSKSASPLCEHTEEVLVCGSELIFEGYLLSGTAGASAPLLRRKLGAIAAPGRRFTLAVGDRRRELFAKELTFASEAPFGTGIAEKFRLTAFSDDPYFHAGERTFAGAPRTSSPTALPSALPRATGIMRSVGDLRIENDGEQTCGVAIEVVFNSHSNEFRITSDREDGVMFMGRSFDAGDALEIDTTPGRRSIALAGGDSLLLAVGEGCAFFTAPPGETVLTWNSFSATPPAVVARITPGYLGF